MLTALKEDTCALIFFALEKLRKALQSLTIETDMDTLNGLEINARIYRFLFWREPLKDLVVIF